VPQQEKHTLVNRVLIGAMVSIYFIAAVGAVFGAAILDYPLLLAAISPVGRHLLIAAATTSMFPFVAVLAVRRMVDSVIVYYLGRAYGDRSIQWLERRFVRFGRIIDWMLRVFRRAPAVAVFVAPTLPTYALAGSIKLRPLVYLSVVLAGQVAWMTGIYFAGDALSEWINPAVDFLRAHVVEVILLCACLFLWARIRLRPAPVSVEDHDGR